MRKRSRQLWVFLFALFSLVLVYAFAAQNTVGSSLAGDGSGSVTGYTVTNIRYQLSTTNPYQIAAVQFDLSATATEVYAALGDGNNWIWSSQCTSSGANTWTCTFSNGVSVQPVTQLRVVAAQ